MAKYNSPNTSLSVVCKKATLLPSPSSKTKWFRKTPNGWSIRANGFMRR